MSNSDVLFRHEGVIGRITLNRPKALHALTHGMVASMLAEATDWANDDAVRAIVLDANPGRAFCAGGDIRAILDAAKKQDGSAAAFFNTEYRLNLAISRLHIPYIALIDGLCFGGGMGISMHGSHRVVSENAVLAMPETAIGFFPDIGSSFFLNRCPGEIGMYLALTSTRVKGADLLYTGLATHHVPAARMREIAPRLASGEPADNVLSALSIAAAEAALVQHRAAIDRGFAAPSVEGVIAALRAGDAWSREIAVLLASLSPIGLKVTFRLMRKAKGLELPDCLKMEYRLACRMVEHPDFAEGVRAAVIDKDQHPHWRPATLEQICDDEVERLFESLGPSELTL